MGICPLKFFQPMRIQVFPVVLSISSLHLALVSRLQFTKYKSHIHLSEAKGGITGNESLLQTREIGVQVDEMNCSKEERWQTVCCEIEKDVWLLGGDRLDGLLSEPENCSLPMPVDRLNLNPAADSSLGAT